jgi:chromosome segregation ATPase
LLQPPETAAELERLRAELALSDQRSERRRIAWRMARQRAISIGSAADRYAARAQAGQTALQDMLASLLEAQIERDAALARVAELEAERHTTNESLSEAAEALRANRDRIAELEAELRIGTPWKCHVCGKDNCRDVCVICETDRPDADDPHAFEPEHMGESDAKRRLANCKHCGQGRKAPVHAEVGDVW